MATTRFNNNILVAAQRLKSLRSDATAAGDTAALRYKSSMLARYENRAIREIILEKLTALGARFVDEMPYYMGTATVAGVAGSFSKPSDVVRVLELSSSSGVYQNVSQDILKIAGGIDKIYQGQLVFYEEGSLVKFLPVSSQTMTFRYVKQHQDIVPSNAPGGAGGGKFLAGAASYVAATRVLTAVMSVSFASSDVGKIIVMTDDINVFCGRIAVFTDATHVVLIGDGLSAANIAVLTSVLVVESSIDSNDILLPDLYDGQIQDKIVAFGLADAVANVQ